jgi:hypothetical protein
MLLLWLLKGREIRERMVRLRLLEKEMFGLQLDSIVVWRVVYICWRWWQQQVNLVVGVAWLLEYLFM